MSVKDINILIRSVIDRKDDEEKIREEISRINLSVSKFNLMPETTKDITKGINTIQNIIGEAESNQVESKEYIRNIFNAITLFSGSIALSNYFKEIINSLKAINDVQERYLEYGSILLKYGWTPTRHVNFSVISKIIDVYKRTNIDKKRIKIMIEEVIIEYYRKHALDRIIKEWGRKRLLSERMGILNDAIEAHLNGKFNLSVPIMMAQLEGIVAAGFYHKGRLYEKRYRTYLNEIILINSNGYFDNLAIDFFIKVLMIEFNHGEKINSLVSRHAILHGADVRYGTEENSLKLILLFDYIQDKFKYFSVNKSDYHEVGCNMVLPIKRSIKYTKEKNIPIYNPRDYFMIKGKKEEICYIKKSIKFYNNEKDVQNNGLSPCRVCIKNR